MKINYIFFTILIHSVFLSEELSDLNVANETEVNPESYSSEEVLSQEDEAEKYVKEFGFDRPGTIITLAMYKEFLKKMFTRGEKIESADEIFFNELIEKICETVPKEFDSKDLSKYIDQEHFSKILDELVSSKYGQDILEKFKSDSEEIKNDL